MARGEWQGLGFVVDALFARLQVHAAALWVSRAPGTQPDWNTLSDLAEQAAEMIGADPMLTRVGAIYHDVGKVDDPSFFIEN